MPNLPATYAEFEVQQFKAAVYFTSCLPLGGAQYSTKRYKTFKGACRDAIRRKGPGGRGCLVYAVSKAKHTILLTRERWPEWGQVK